MSQSKVRVPVRLEGGIKPVASWINLIVVTINDRGLRYLIDFIGNQIKRMLFDQIILSHYGDIFTRYGFQSSYQCLLSTLVFLKIQDFDPAVLGGKMIKQVLFFLQNRRHYQNTAFPLFIYLISEGGE